jgi:hypothetical protein
VEIFWREVPGSPIGVYAGDNGVVSTSPFMVMVLAVMMYLNSQGITANTGEAYLHNNGLSVVERAGRTIKELVLFGMLYVLNNPNFQEFGFTKKHIIQLWGELVNWAVSVINLKECPHVSGKTKYEIYYKIVAYICMSLCDAVREN